MEKEKGKFVIEIDRDQITGIINKIIQSKIESEMSLQMKSIDKSIEEYFQKSFFNDKVTMFDSALDYTIESAFRIGVSKAMEELNFTEIIAQKSKELLMNDSFIHKLAEDKVRSSLGLLPKK